MHHFETDGDDTRMMLALGKLLLILAVVGGPVAGVAIFLLRGV